ncbi:MAG TPA: histidine kinase N-terminal 7TM domain-containing protein, partial [Pyrinomonadaceae bacterium]|nr:histidine kinase N-terminal 7TM domain-containing protein [Pyrinomonadaceae bacterium]
MPNFLNLPVIYLSVSIIVSIVMGIYAWRNPQTRGSRAFAFACLISGFWMFGDMVSRISETVAGEFRRGGGERRFAGYHRPQWPSN